MNRTETSKVVVSCTDLRIMIGVKLLKKTDLNPNLRIMSIERRRLKYGRAWDGRCWFVKRRKKTNLNPNVRMMRRMTSLGRRN